MSNKIEKGIFYTIYNPFHAFPLSHWVDAVEKREGKDFYLLKFLEPFAGANNIVDMFQPLSNDIDWSCYDIHPNNINNTSGIEVQKRDTLVNFPKGFDVVITNPPYLAKNRARRLGLAYPKVAEKYEDLYLCAIDKVLENVKYAAMIIPDSFIQKVNRYEQHIVAIDRCAKTLFEDTDEPVCVVYFVKNANKDIKLYSDGNYIGTFQEFKNKELSSELDIPWDFNNPDGEIGLIAIDNIREASIRFVPGEKLADRKIYVSSRSYTRIAGLPKDIDRRRLLTLANMLLEEYRLDTKDLFLTAYKGVRKDGQLRRRLNFKKARIILNLAVEKIRKGEEINDRAS